MKTKQTFKQLTLNAVLGAVVIGASLNARADFDYPGSNFKNMYNKYRVSQAKVTPWPGSYWPFDGEEQIEEATEEKVGDGTKKRSVIYRGAGINHKPKGYKLSPAEKYDLFMGLNGKAAKWEEENHNCRTVAPELLKDCKEWYGHCNGWAGAALFNPEPSYDKDITATHPWTGVTMTFTHMDIKALLNEAWLDAWASFEGTGVTVKADDWVYDPNDPIARAPADNNPDLTNYDAYWDVSPRTLFYALTNYVGIRKVGIALDRFTGAEIWNQPLIAYRFLPITGPTDVAIEKDGQKVYPITIGVKLYWANDEVDYDFKSKESLKWDVNDPIFSNDKVPDPVSSPLAQDRVRDEAVISRYIEFTLFMDRPTKVSADGTRILAAGRILGDGFWAHADPAQRARWFPKDAEKSQTHPDFLWRPDYLTDASFRNPWVDPLPIYKHILNRPLGEMGSELTPNLK